MLDDADEDEEVILLYVYVKTNGTLPYFASKKMWHRHINNERAVLTQTVRLLKQPYAGNTVDR